MIMKYPTKVCVFINLVFRSKQNARVVKITFML